jgi:hypothetical protein
MQRGSKECLGKQYIDSSNADGCEQGTWRDSYLSIEPMCSGSSRNGPAAQERESDTMDEVDHVRQILRGMTEAEQRQVLAQLRELLPKHPMETQLMISADGMLDALARAGDFTVRMIRGIFAEYAFAADVLPTLAPTWRSIQILGDPPYDFRLTDTPLDQPLAPNAPVRLQVKMQRSEGKIPLTADQQWKTLVKWPSSHYVVEIQKSRKGEKKGENTRPYRFGEFDLLAVSLGPAKGRWSAFMYTVERWLLPKPDDPTQLLTFQPVAPADSDCWTSNFLTAVQWLRSGVNKRIDGDLPKPRRNAK